MKLLVNNWGYFILYFYNLFVCSFLEKIFINVIDPPKGFIIPLPHILMSFYCFHMHEIG
jgi:hypothetical protein